MSYYSIMSKKSIEHLKILKKYFDPTSPVKRINTTKATEHIDYVIRFLNDIIEDEYVAQD